MAFFFTKNIAFAVPNFILQDHLPGITLTYYKKKNKIICYFNY